MAGVDISVRFRRDRLTVTLPGGEEPVDRAVSDSPFAGWIERYRKAVKCASPDVVLTDLGREIAGRVEGIDE